jgi:hypothetical protein
VAGAHTGYRAGPAAGDLLMRRWAARTTRARNISGVAGVVSFAGPRPVVDRLHRR